MPLPADPVLCLAENSFEYGGDLVVLVDPTNKRLLTVLNGDAATERVGDYVEISGDLDEQTGTLHIESLKLLEKGRAKCDVPQKKKT